MGLIGAIISVLVQVAIWAYIFRNDLEMMKYMMAYIVLSQLLMQLFNNSITGEVANKISTGAFTTDLIKPANLILVYWGPAAGTTLANMIVRGLPLLIIFSPILANAIHMSVAKLLVFLCICFGAYMMVSTIYMLTGFLAFITTEARWFPRILLDTINFFSGAIIPLAFFPDWLAFITKMLPFHLIFSFPIRFLLEDLPQNEITSNLTLLAGWLVFLLLLAQLTYQRSIWRCVVQGG